MAEIQRGKMDISDVRQGDTFDVCFDIEGIDLTGATLIMQVRVRPKAPVVLTFFGEDDSLQLSVNDEETGYTLRLHKPASQMNIRPEVYQYDIEMHTGDEVLTIIEGFFQITNQITQV